MGVAEVIREVTGFVPTEGQAKILASRKRQVLVSGGEQAGKSLCGAMFLLERIPEVEERALYWLVAADYERTRAEFDYLVEDLGKLGMLLGYSKRVDPGYIEFGDKSRVETKSAKDPRTLAMRAPHGIVICEASQVDLETMWKCRARVAPKRGWLFMSGTMESSLGWFPSLVTEWLTGVGESQSFLLPSTGNTYIYPEGENDPELLRLKREASDDFFMERIMGQPRPPRGLVFPEFKVERHVKGVEWEPGRMVQLWIDPGYDGAYAVEVVQVMEGQVRVIDEIYERGLVTEEVIQVCQGRAWWKDVRVGVIDVAGYQHQAMSAPAEVWLEKTGLSLLSEKVRITDGTERLKVMLKLDPLVKEPILVINPRCRGLLSEFGAAANPFDGQMHVYRWKTDREGNLVGDSPDDKWNHGCKALIYGLVAELGYVTVSKREHFLVKRF